MEKKINNKIEDYLDEFKTKIKTWVEENDSISFHVKSDLLKFIYDYDKLNLEKDDFNKRKRLKSNVPHYLRCLAKRANGEQCTRKKKDENDYCGTHDKNRPHGIVNIDDINIKETKKVEVWVQDINGIVYYIDNNNNIYKTEDILSNITNPSIIAKYKIDENGNYIYVN